MAKLRKHNLGHVSAVLMILRKLPITVFKAFHHKFLTGHYAYTFCSERRIEVTIDGLWGPLAFEQYCVNNLHNFVIVQNNFFLNFDFTQLSNYKVLSGE